FIETVSRKVFISMRHDNILVEAGFKFGGIFKSVENMLINQNTFSRTILLEVSSDIHRYGYHAADLIIVRNHAKHNTNSKIHRSPHLRFCFIMPILESLE